MRGVRRASVRARRVLARAVRALGQLGGGLGTALLALGLLVVAAAVAAACLLGVGLLAAPAVLRGVRALAERERARLGRWGPGLVGPAPLPPGLRDALADPAVRREGAWLAVHASVGLLLGAVGVLLPVYAAQDLTFPLWWRLLPAGRATDPLELVTVHDRGDVGAVVGMGVVLLVLTATLTPAMARLQGSLGRALLVPPPGTDLTLRVAELTATRAAALDAHAVELRRIERALHDGAQNRLVAVALLVGAARRAVARDPAGAEELLERAQGAAELALAELRTVARGVLPPVLADRGLAAALTGLAAASPVPCRVDLAATGPCAASVEATAYHVVAEALTNTARHAGAASVELRAVRVGDRLRVVVRDDGRGGADASAGSGLDGLRRRVAAHDGTMTLSSPPGGPTTLTVELPCGS